MKTNALIRTIAFSVTLVLLVLAAPFFGVSLQVAIERDVMAFSPERGSAR